ncbi:hypothetical protein OHB25_51540 [Streptomyces mirabilis]|uniref:hypothetical protein n=1 Tax=Streptomyces TaxID=1883 RepID=UPI0013E02D70|nr:MULTISPECIES: hypothetical protein [Streptomyces]MCX4616345.1 hypothetical protein [Streptomyces mirabilis]MCX5346893.1 hypothetical protein [Streptomyces mirabilis]
MSGSLRTLIRAQGFATIRICLASADRHDHGRNMVDTLERATCGRPWTPATT